MEINSVFDKLLPEVLIIEEKNVNISLSNDIREQDLI
ncbi:MAG: Transposase [Rickettsia helvetica]|uniref:Transposase n=1 Tax=Rickettsia helvetica TaxID=35789 RepID=A0ABP0T4H0_RICHE